jgi:Undecaprenyl-phosphate glucose phosphotransferase
MIPKELIMQNDNRGLFDMLETYVDMLINLIAFLASYLFVLIVEEHLVDLTNPVTIDLTHPVTIAILFLNMLMSSITYHILNLYKPMRYSRPFRSFPIVFKVNLVYFGTLAVVSTFVTRVGYRQFILFWILFSAIVSTAFLTFKRHIIRVALSLLRSKQYHLRKVIIIGDNTATAVEYINEVASNSQYGMMVIGYVGDKIDRAEIGVEKLGSFKDLAKVLDKYRPTDAVFAIDAYDKRHLIRLVNMCDDRCIKVYFLPVIYGFFKNSRQIEQVGSIPLINIHSTPLDNFANAALKRAVDIVGALFLILLTSPFMIFAAIGIKISSPGPIFFKQQRVGRLGKKFTMLKFRSMRVNAESNSAWTTGTDPRKTRFGTFLRRTAIDELPQLFNVLAGSMSLVGPRPEIPVFVEHFKEIVPLYMIKHYVKPGITGLAQIKGYRGDTSIEARIHEDIKYIENWSLMLDLYVLLKTPLKAVNKSEVYVAPEKEENKEAEGEEKSQELPEAPKPEDMSKAGQEKEGGSSNITEEVKTDSVQPSQQDAEENVNE